MLHNTSQGHKALRGCKDSPHDLSESGNFQLCRKVHVGDSCVLIDLSVSHVDASLDQDRVLPDVGFHAAIASNA